ncbi:hypothetical protein J4404_02230 [Candidatus Woesearchaeota archaeon]|nr:hypothetical protein [Candidatus Woesearchaeota archaeon]
MAKISAKDVIETVIDVIVSSYGNLGYVGFRLHSIKQNHKENVYIAKYSFIPRENKESKRVFYEARVNIKDKNIFETKEISESMLSKEDDN